MVVLNISRFEIWLVGLNPTQGKEINKTRPCVIISPNEMSALSTVLVAPMTSEGFNFPCRVECEFKGKKGLILLDQIRAVDKTRLIKKLGILDAGTQVKLCSSLQEMFVF
ncbi:mRNA interferase MazF [Bathymodiolus platifrons methanotrophic gill symbiont]|uniref:type II toxin-antitoxin system PemK/MazF family toxin n=1 Tax=Bathymodiolus platifrons methanotrophic gill symbiont TaxID=113268 RepID=UPI001B3F53B4|nr:type II toxin-antitoxin system PemK/MazF family toxin [Bathymodiolus platifrons methanotrophic gill symbiont]GFO74693.1 mRNA interferase MazF [Bathymodiolus platifrons methanotrophic gill symbiont]